MKPKITYQGSNGPPSAFGANVILVEGQDDRDFVEAQIKDLGFTSEWHIHVTKGTPRPYKDLFKNIINDPKFKRNGNSISVMVDADANATLPTNKIKDGFKHNHLSEPVAHAVVNDFKQIKTGFFIMPDGTSPGELENLLLKAIPDPTRKTIAQGFINSLPPTFLPLKKPAKNELQSYFATQKEFTRWIGNALADTSIMSVSDPVFQQFRDFLTSLQG